MKRAAELAILALLGVALTTLWLHYAQIDYGWPWGIAGLVAGTAPKPFVYRQLSALLVRLVMALSGFSIYPAATVLVALCFIGWLWALRWLAQLVTPNSAMVATVLAVGPVGLLFVSGGYVYDVVTLCLFTLALGLMAHRRWLAYLALFPALVLCRETSAVLIVVYVLWAWPRVERPTFWRALGWQVMVFVALKTALAYIYRDNSGALAETYWVDQIAWVLTYPQPNELALLVYGGALAAGLWRWRDQHPFTRAAAIIIPAIFAAYWVFGFPGEIRQCLEGYTALYLLTWHTVWTRLGRPTVATIARWGGARGSPKATMLHQ